MKIRKTGIQQNVALDKMMYSEAELDAMLANNEVSILKNPLKNDDFVKNPFTQEKQTAFYNDDNIRLFLNGKDEIKVIYEDGHYFTVVTTKDGKTYYVDLQH